VDKHPQQYSLADIASLFSGYDCTTNTLKANPNRLVFLPTTACLRGFLRVLDCGESRFCHPYLPPKAQVIRNCAIFLVKNGAVG
jgi:hypothetical protein